MRVHRVAEIWVDAAWHATRERDEACPSPGLLTVRPLWEDSVLVGRPSAGATVQPQLDCGADHGVSRRHVQLTTDGKRWWAEDLRSSNGTYIGPADGSLPTTPIPPGRRIEFAVGDRIYLGSWTRIVIREVRLDP